MANRTTKTQTTKHAQKYPPHQYGVWETDGDITFLTTRDTIDEVADDLKSGEETEVAVYEFKEVVKIRRGAIVLEK